MFRTKAFLSLITVGLFAQTGWTKDFLVKIDPRSDRAVAELYSLPGTSVEDIGLDGWYLVKESVVVAPQFALSVQALRSNRNVLWAQPNYKMHSFGQVQSPSIHALKGWLQPQSPIWRTTRAGGMPDNPAVVPRTGNASTGADPQFAQQWGMNDIGVVQGWQRSRGSQNMIVAVIDSGVDYTHEDLAQGIWHNPGETGVDAQGRQKSSNGVDDDNNGFIDDQIGWDFVTDDNRPYDLTVSESSILAGGGNPGHGTHCAGVVGARASNGKGVVGVAPNITIMALRGLSEKGQGDTAGLIRAIKYAVDNGAKVLSNSWGGEGEDGPENQALRDSVAYAEARGVLFIVAAGNGRAGANCPGTPADCVPRGFDIDTDTKPVWPAAFNMSNMITVAAIASNNELGSFSNFGQNKVHIAAPGVKVMSTVPGNDYSDTVLRSPMIIAILRMLGQQNPTWDGTSMATPHVAGAAALYWSLHPNKSMYEVRQALLNSATYVPALNGKITTAGKLSVSSLMNTP